MGRLKSMKVMIDQSAILYMPSEPDLYFPIGDARYEAAMMSTVTLTPIPSLWGIRQAQARIRRT
jgi:hypothetical protein